MINMMLSTAADALQANMTGNDVEFTGCSTDSRTIKSGELFIALAGENFNGHEFIGKARQGGAVAAMVEAGNREALPQIQVGNTRISMGRLAQLWRDNFRIPVIAVTGSNGKTTVKELVSTILSQQAPVISTAGNLNNEIGVPLTLFNLGKEHSYAVIEIGANHPGEISTLTRIVKPDVALITQCAPAHLEGFGSVEGVARAKAEIYEGLGKTGTAIINNDDQYASLWRQKAGHVAQLSFGLSDGADVTARDIERDAGTGSSRFVLVTPKGEVPVNLHLPGIHNVINALSATACCLAVDVPLEVIRAGLEAATSFKGRLQVKKGLHGSTIVDDTYNANPASLDAAMSLVSERPGRHWLALGDMGELGRESAELHMQAGEKAREYGFEKLYCLGELTAEAVQGFGNGARHFPDANSLVDQLKNELSGDVTLLVKGSRAMSMEYVVEGLKEAD